MLYYPLKRNSFITGAKKNISLLLEKFPIVEMDGLEHLLLLYVIMQLFLLYAVMGLVNGMCGSGLSQ